MLLLAVHHLLDEAEPLAQAEAKEVEEKYMNKKEDKEDAGEKTEPPRAESDGGRAHSYTILGEAIALLEIGVKVRITSIMRI